MSLEDELEEYSANDAELRAKLELSRRAQRAADSQNASLLERMAELERALDLVNAGEAASIEPPKWLADPSTARKKHAT